jgi:hypothetical protein
MGDILNIPLSCSEEALEELLRKPLGHFSTRQLSGS